MESDNHIYFSSHLPLLIKIVTQTTGDVLECGTGFFSTPVLHWLCVPDKRKLVSYESDKHFYKIAKQYSNEFHAVNYVENWDNIEIEKPWDVAFIDHEADRRCIEARRVANYAQFVIIHDTCGRDEWCYHYKELFSFYKYNYQFLIRPRTRLLSNFVDVNELGLWT